ncbi:hypothetical protein SUGI_0603330 [Cryptomeria japonica]|nr:hypothetical protein SUGI_0603330 [Cryptomeria japonica]
MSTRDAKHHVPARVRNVMVEENRKCMGGGGELEKVNVHARKKNQSWTRKNIHNQVLLSTTVTCLGSQVLKPLVPAVLGRGNGEGPLLGLLSSHLDPKARQSMRKVRHMLRLEPEVASSADL